MLHYYRTLWNNIYNPEQNISTLYTIMNNKYTVRNTFLYENVALYTFIILFASIETFVILYTIAIVYGTFFFKITDNKYIICTYKVQ